MGSVLSKCFEESEEREEIAYWQKKALHGQYLRQTKEVKSEQSWVWLHNRDLKRETENLVAAAQNPI